MKPDHIHGGILPLHWERVGVRGYNLSIDRTPSPGAPRRPPPGEGIPVVIRGKIYEPIGYYAPSVVIEKSPSLSQLAQQGDFSISNHTRIIGLLVSLGIPKFAKELAAE